MSKVNIKKITYPYINIELLNKDCAEDIGANLSQLYLYIDRHKNMGSTYEYGNAYRAIKEKANNLMGRKDIKISKRQVISVRRYFTILGTNKYIKVPYTLYYIFKAIFEIVDDLKAEYPLPDELKKFVGQIRRDIFYKEQSDLFAIWYPEHRDELTRGLYDDIFANKSILGINF